MWYRLAKLPFFKKASAERQEEMYFKELEREERAKEREYELKKLQLVESKSSPKMTQGGISHAKVKLPLWEEKCKMDKYLETCEKLLSGVQVPRDLWTFHILPNLPEKARSLDNHLPSDKANVYDHLKKILLDHYATSPLSIEKTSSTGLRETARVMLSMWRA